MHISAWVVVLVIFITCCVLSGCCAAQHSQLARALACRQVAAPSRAHARTHLPQVLALCILKGVITACCCLQHLDWASILGDAKSQASGAKDGGKGGVNELTRLAPGGSAAVR